MTFLRSRVEDYALISDLHAAALVSRGGSIGRLERWRRLPVP